MPDSLSPVSPSGYSTVDEYEPQPHTRLDIKSVNARALGFAWEAVKGRREDVNGFYIEGLSMLRRGRAAGIERDALYLMACALHDAIGECVGKMQRTLEDAGTTNFDPAQVDRSELDEFMREVG